MTLKDLVYNKIDDLLKQKTLSDDLRKTFLSYLDTCKEKVLLAIGQVVTENFKKGVILSDFDLDSIIELAFDIHLMEIKSYYDKMYHTAQYNRDLETVKSKLLIFLKDKSDRSQFLFLQSMSKGNKNGPKGTSL